MNLPPQSPDESRDPVWTLLAQAPPATASPRFLDNTVRAARLTPQSKPWWRRVFTAAPLAGLTATAATAAVVIWVCWSVPHPSGSNGLSLLNSPQADEIQDVAETEALLAAVDQLDDFSDTELASLIGF